MTLEKKLSDDAIEQTERKQISCTKCGGTDLMRVPRGFLFKKILSFLPIKRYICQGCLNKFYKLDS